MATRTISTKLAVEGESQYKQAIKSISSELTTLDSRLKLVQSEYAGQQNSMEALRAKAKALSEVQAAQSEKVRTLKDAYNNAKSALEEYASKSERLRRRLPRMRMRCPDCLTRQKARARSGMTTGRSWQRRKIS